LLLAHACLGIILLYSIYVYITDGSLWALSVDQLDAYGDEDDEGGVQETLLLSLPIVPSCGTLWNSSFIHRSCFRFKFQKPLAPLRQETVANLAQTPSKSTLLLDARLVKGGNCHFAAQC
jgi:hypothetical protein